jgi:Domain of unknown function (DUF4260)
MKLHAIQTGSVRIKRAQVEGHGRGLRRRLAVFVHMDALPLALAGVSFALGQSGPMTFALIWLAHIGLDRTLGYGLKYPTFFEDTHLQRVTEPRTAA